MPCRNPLQSSRYSPPIFIILLAVLFAGVPATTQATERAEPMVVRMTGENYRWQIQYPGEDGIFDTKDDVLTPEDIHIPAHHDVRIELKSNDLLYTLTLEEKDLTETAVPGLTFSLDIEAGEAGAFEYTGSHMCGTVPQQDLDGKLIVESPSDFNNWLRTARKEEGRISSAAEGPGFPVPSLVDPQGAPPALGVVPEFKLTDQFGEIFRSSGLMGKVWVANFIFTRCPSSCPLQTARMKRIQEKMLGELSAEETALISVTVDPDYDQPVVLKEFTKEHEVNEAHWKFLTGSRDDIWNLSKDGFKMAVGEQPGKDSTLLFHSTLMVLVDDLGRIRGYYDGMSMAGEEALLADVNKVLREERRDWIAVPSGIMDPSWLKKIQEEQFRSVPERAHLYDLRFSDRLEESGIDFRHQITADAGINYKANHYNHGSGMCIADIDSDGLYDIYFVSQLGGNRLYRNLGGGKFEDGTQKAGVALKDAVGAGCSFADVDNDGDADLFVPTVRSGNVLFENDGSGRFRDITKKAGLTYSGHSSAAVFFDYDRDGFLDLFLTNVGVFTGKNKVSVIREGKSAAYYDGLADAFSGHLKPERSEASILYRNLGKGKFKNVSKEMRLMDRSWSGDSSILDANADGWPDIYVLNMQGHDHYYENNKGEYFTDRTGDLFPKTPWGSTGIKVFDHNNDGLMDIYVTDLHSDLHKNIGPGTEKYKPLKIYSEGYTQSQGKSIYGNAFFENAGAGKFREISDRLGVEMYWPWGPSVGDLNADGYEDIFVASGMNYPWRYAVDKVLLNLEGKEFLDAEFLLGIEPRPEGKTATPWFSLDCSGKDRGHKDCRFQESEMTVWGALGSRSSAIFDLDNDGDLDIVTNDFNSAPMVLMSDLAQRREIHFLKVNLVGEGSNRSAIGATVKVSAGGQTFTRFYDGKSGYLSQSLFPHYFGLGEATAVERIEVIWPSGKTQVVEGPIKVNTLMEIKEGQDYKDQGGSEKTPFGERPRSTDHGKPFIATFGNSVDELEDNETWQEYLAGMLGRDVFNFGAAGDGLDQAYEKFREKYAQVHTPVVVLELTMDAINRMEDLSQLFSNLDAFVADVSSAGASPIIMVTPHPREIIAKMDKDMDSVSLGPLREFCRERQYLYLDLQDAFIRHVRKNRPLSEIYHEHLTALGSRLIANELSEFLKSMQGAQDANLWPQIELDGGRAARASLDKKYWSTELLAQEYELIFIKLWDEMRMDTQNFTYLKEFPFKTIMLPTERKNTPLELGVVSADYAGAPRTYTKEEFISILERLQQEGYRIDQVEFHHEEFTYARPEEAASIFSFIFGVANDKTGRKYSLNGEFRVAWDTRKDEAGYFLPKTIEVGRLVSLGREARDPSFITLFKVAAESKFRGSNPFVMYDLDRDGFSEMIVPALNLIIRNRGNGTFDEEDLLPKPLSGMSSAFVGELTGDGQPDLVVTLIWEAPLLFKGRDGAFDPQPVAINIAKEFKGYPGAFNAISAGDIDGDGDLDLFLGQYKGPHVEDAMPPSPYYDANDGEMSHLLQNDGLGNFTDITLEAGLGPKRLRRTNSASFVDLDRDRDLDLVVVSNFAGVDLYSNDGKGKFTDVTWDAVDQSALMGRALSVADFDLDGNMDLYVTGQSSTAARRLSKMDVSVDHYKKHQEMIQPMSYGNRLYSGTKEPGIFRSASNNDQLARGGWAWGVTNFDLDNDGDQEIYVANGHDSNMSALNYDSFYWRQDIFMEDQPVDLSAARDLYARGGSWGGFEHNRLYLNGRGESFTDIGFLMDVAFEFDARSVATDDINMDGRADLIVSDTKGNIQTFLNAVKTDNHWVGIMVEESGNRSPLGAVVTVATPEGKKEWQVVSGESFICQHPYKRVFGLNKTVQIDYIEVQWLDGKTKRLDRPAADRYHRILPPQ